MKKILLVLFTSLIFFTRQVHAEDFSNLNYMDWNLTRQDYTSLNYGNTPFMTSYLGRDYPNARLLLDYTNYTIYPGYYYDIELEYFFDDKTDMGSLNFADGVTSCDIYPYNVSGYTSDGCSIIDQTSTSIKIKTNNLRTNSASRIVLQYNNTFNFTNFPTYIVWVQFNSYRLRIIRKDNTGLTNETFEQGISDINNTINNSTNNITNSIDDLQDTIDDDSIDTSSSNSFFNNFSTTDNGGISTVITAPLDFVRSITNTCSPISFTIFEETITLPCGDTLFWGRSDVQTFRNVWNVIVGGAFVYMLLSKLFKTIENMKDPQSDKVEVMKL